MRTPGGRWRLALGAAAFALWAPVSLFALPFAALTLATRPRERGERLALALAGVASVWALTGPSAGALDAALRAFAVCVTAAFVLFALYRPGGFLTRALAAILVGGAATMALGWTVWGVDFAAALHWDATRLANKAGHVLLAARPEMLAAFDPVVRSIVATLPAITVLQTLAGLALAWHYHHEIAAQPLGEPLAPFREFRFGDHWVWSLVAALTVWLVPMLGALKGAALNLGVVAATLYLLRGAAIVMAFAQAAGISSVALIVSTTVAAALAVPLLLIVPGLWTLGVTDTWLAFRRRLAARSQGQ